MVGKTVEFQVFQLNWTGFLLLLRWSWMSAGAAADIAQSRRCPDHVRVLRGLSHRLGSWTWAVGPRAAPPHVAMEPPSSLGGGRRTMGAPSSKGRCGPHADASANTTNIPLSSRSNCLFLRPAVSEPAEDTSFLQLDLLLYLKCLSKEFREINLSS